MHKISHARNILPALDKMPKDTAKLPAAGILGKVSKRFNVDEKGNGKNKTMRYMRGVAKLLDGHGHWKDGLLVDVTGCNQAEREWVKAMIIFYHGAEPECDTINGTPYVRSWGYAC